MTNDTQPAKRTVKAAPRKAANKTTPPTAAATPRKAAKKTTPAAPRARKPATSPSAPLPSPGWYIDPAAPSTQRFWDGEGWTGDSIAATPDELRDPALQFPQPQRLDTLPITFRGHELIVQRPSPEQLVVWRRVATRMTDALHTGQQVTNQEAAQLLDRGISVITSVIANRVDKDWLEDQMLDGVLTLVQAAEVLNLTIDAFTGPQPAPTTGPKPRARRR